MRKSYGCLGWLVCLLTTAAVFAQAPAPPGPPLRDLWDAAFLDGNRAGYINTRVHEFERGGHKLYQTRVYLDLTLRRFADTIRQQMETGSVETADGKVTAVWMSQTLAKDLKLNLVGKVEGNQLAVQWSGAQQGERKIPWNDQVIGLYREHRLFQEKKAKPGDKFSYQHYEPLINNVVNVVVTVKDVETVAIGKSQRQLLRAEAIPDKVMSVQLPRTAFWLDQDLLVVRSEVDMPGLGKLVLLRTTKDVALSPVTPGKVADIGLTQLVHLNRGILRPAEVNRAVYRITLPQDDEPAKALAEDRRQQIKDAKGKSFLLHVQAVRQPEAAGPAAKAADEFLQSNYFINCEDAKVKDLARRAVGSASDPWRKAQQIEKWVYQNMQVQNFSQAMATADHVAKTLEGDCTEYAMLTAAMCRAAGVPARTAIGLIYVEMPRGPVFAYHMWTEVHVQGQWLALDATLGRGSVGATHIKITDHSWHETRSLAPLLPVTRVLLGKVAIEVVDAR